MRIIDIHVHVFPDKIAAQTVKSLEKAAPEATAYLDGTISALKSSIRKAKIDLAVNQPISTKPSQVKSINEWAAEVQNDRILSFGTVHPEFDELKGEIKRLNEKGIKGIKLHPDYQKFHPDDRAVYPIYEAICENEMIILFHAGIDIELYPPVHCTPKSLANVLRDFPEIKIIASHMGGYKMWDEVEEYLLGKDIYFDTSYSIDYMPLERFVNLMRKHGFDRILFGTDSPWKEQEEEVKKIISLDIPEAVKEDIFWRNADKLLSDW